MTTVREFSFAGPCLKLGRFVRETAKFVVYHEWLGGDHYSAKEKRVAKRTVHLEACKRCVDHEHTVYPFGYMD